LPLRHLLPLLTMAVVSIGTGDLSAQSAQGSFPVDGAAPIASNPTAPFLQAGWVQDNCTKEFQPLRLEAERRGQLIKAATDRHATPDEACKLIGDFILAQIRMIKFVESHATKCGIPGQVAEQLTNGHRDTENMQRKVCAMVRPGPLPAGDFDIPLIR